MKEFYIWYLFAVVSGKETWYNAVETKQDGGRLRKSKSFREL